MADVVDDLDKLLTDVRKTISDNKLFLENLVDESTEEIPEESTEAATTDEEFEEL